MVTTASKLEQLSKCRRSVLDSPQDLQRGYSSGQSRAASIGTKLHSCLDVVVKSYSKYGLFDGAWNSGLEKAKELDVVLEFLSMSKRLVEDSIHDKSTIRSEVAMAISRSGKARVIDAYNDLKDDDVFAGTADVIALESRNEIVVIDWKTGLEDVSSIENLQLISLAWMCMLIDKEISIAKVSIVNPVLVTASHSVYTREGIKQRMDRFQIDLSKERHLESYGPHCKYCPIKSICGEFADHSMKVWEEYK